MRDNSIQRIGNYRLVKRLGKGAFAEVWLSEHIYLKTRAAIKMLHTELTSDALKNFMKEAQVLVGLKHPHIISILDFGIEGKDTPYLVMEYATKGTMRDRHPKGSTVPLAVVVSYVKQLTEAVQYAHDQRYIHRDIKPENMLIGSADEILLSDFGIAAIAHRTGSLSPQEFSGTISYSAPEQIEDLPQPASDQYALAITVYEWLCGSVPFTGGFTAIALKHLHESPQSLSQRVPIPLGVEQVVMKALEKSPKDRYPTIQMFAEALERASNRSQGMVSATTPAFCCSTCGNTLQPNHKFCSKCGTPRDGLNTQGTDLVAPRTQAPTIATEGGVPQLEIKFKEYKTLAILFSLTWSPDGKHIAGVDDCDCYVWDAHTGETVSVHGIPVPLSSQVFPVACAWSPDRKRIVVASDIGTVSILDVYTGEEILVYRGHSNAETAFSLAWSPDSKHIASAGHSDPTISVWDAHTGRISNQIQSSGITSLAWSPDGKHIAAAKNPDTLVQVLDVSTGKEVSAHTHPHEVRSLAWSPDGKHIAFVSHDDDHDVGSTIEVWDVCADKQIRVCVYRGHRTRNGHGETVIFFDWSPDGKHIASAGLNDSAIWVWDSQTGKDVFVSSKVGRFITNVAWSPDGKSIAYGPYHIGIGSGPRRGYWLRVLKLPDL